MDRSGRYLDYLRGWYISELNNHWYAIRNGVRMNTSSHEGIVTMILKRSY